MSDANWRLLVSFVLASLLYLALRFGWVVWSMFT